MLQVAVVATAQGRRHQHSHQRQRPCQNSTLSTMMVHLKVPQHQVLTITN